MGYLYSYKNLRTLRPHILALSVSVRIFLINILKIRRKDKILVFRVETPLIETRKISNERLKPNIQIMN